MCCIATATPSSNKIGDMINCEVVMLPHKIFVKLVTIERYKQKIVRLLVVFVIRREVMYEFGYFKCRHFGFLGGGGGGNHCNRGLVWMHSPYENSSFLQCKPAELKIRQTLKGVAFGFKETGTSSFYNSCDAKPPRLYDVHSIHLHAYIHNVYNRIYADTDTGAGADRLSLTHRQTDRQTDRDTRCEVEHSLFSRHHQWREKPTDQSCVVICNLFNFVLLLMSVFNKGSAKYMHSDWLMQTEYISYSNRRELIFRTK